MSRVVVYDLADTARRVTVQRRHWRATLQLLYRDSVLNKQRLGRLDWRVGGTGASITLDECVAIAAYLKASVLPYLQDGEALAVPGDNPQVDAVTDGTIRGFPGFGLGEMAAPKAANLPRQWLQELADLLSTAGGVGAIEEGFLPMPRLGGGRN